MKRRKGGVKQILDDECFMAIPGLIAMGKTSREIAALLGCTPSTLRVKCHFRRISLKPAPRMTVRKYARPPSRMRQVRLSPEIVAALEIKAKERRKCARHLVEELLRILVTEPALIDNLMDDK